jgi:DNA-binding NtrC family response regulator
MAGILVVDDESRVRAILRIMLESENHTVHEAAGGEEALAVIQDKEIDLVISDIRMDGMDGTQLLATIKQKDLACPVVFITAYASVESAIDALRLGAVDYLVKPFEEAHVLLAVERGLGMGRLMTENRWLKADLNDRKSNTGKVFVSPQIRAVKNMALQVAPKDTTVLITGDSGTGKEVIARLIHEASPRCSGRFVAVNCAAISENLVESELFGHEKGAFTGAAARREGKFEYADKGTLFLDEIADLPGDVQVKLLRVIQERCFQRVGGNREVSVDVRLVCATNQSLEKMVDKGRFRRDLFYRLAVFPIDIPCLHERKADIIPMARHFIRQHASSGDVNGDLLTSAAAQMLREYPWPGNIRELANAMERVMIIKGNQLPVTSDDLGFLRTGPANADAVDELFVLPPSGIDYDELQKSIVKKALQMTGWNQSAASRLLGLSRQRFRTLFTLIQDNGEGAGSRQ